MFANSTNCLTEFAGVLVFAAEEILQATVKDMQRQLQLCRDENRQLLEELMEAKRQEGELAASQLLQACRKCCVLESQLKDAQAKKAAQQALLDDCTRELALKAEVTPSKPVTKSQDEQWGVRFRACQLVWQFPNPGQKCPAKVTVTIGDRDLQAAFISTALELYPRQTGAFFDTLWKERAGESYALRRPYQQAMESGFRTPALEDLIEQDSLALSVLTQVRQANGLQL